MTLHTVRSPPEPGSLDRTLKSSIGLDMHLIFASSISLAEPLDQIRSSGLFAYECDASLPLRRVGQPMSRRNCAKPLASAGLRQLSALRDGLQGRPRQTVRVWRRTCA